MGYEASIIVFNLKGTQVKIASHINLKNCICRTAFSISIRWFSYYTDQETWLFTILKAHSLESVVCILVKHQPYNIRYTIEIQKAGYESSMHNLKGTQVKFASHINLKELHVVYVFLRFHKVVLILYQSENFDY